jgi:hypothetical protein
VDTIGIRTWEVTVLIMFLYGLWYWYRYSRTRFTLGLFLGYCLCFGWTWLFDTPLFLDLTFHPESFGGWVWAGHWEPLWTAFSYAALAQPMLWYLRHHERLHAKLGRMFYPIFAYVTSLLVMVYEGLFGVELLGVETYHWKDKHIYFGVPWTNTVLLVPLFLLLPMLFINAARSVLSQAGQPITEKPEGGSHRMALFAGNSASFLLGFAAPQAGLYCTFVIMMPFLDWLQPWTESVRLR